MTNTLQLLQSAVVELTKYQDALEHNGKIEDILEGREELAHLNAALQKEKLKQIRGED